jgi:RimJ/RimL family protein N-acetyltransferase
MTFHLETARLVMRQFKESDLESFLAYRNDPEVAKYQGWSVPYPREKAVSFVRDMSVAVRGQNKWLQIALELKSTTEMIGDVAFFIRKDDERQAVIGYSLARPSWGQGYAFEAIYGLLAYLFDDLYLHRVIAECDVQNASSWKLLDRLGFRREAHLVESVFYEGAYVSEYHYAMLRREWRDRHSSPRRGTETF